jgi:hypothetical protein
VISAALADVATPRPQWTKVRLQSETVNIKLGEDRVDVEATFHMYNQGPSGPVRVGYPLGVFEEKLNDFKVFVDGKELTAVKTQSKATGSSRPMLYGRRPRASKNNTAAEPYRFDGPYKEWKVFDVPMAGTKRTTIKVSYWVKPAKIVDAKKRSLLHYTYTLRTGATWKGKIEEAVIAVKLDGVDPSCVVRKVPVGSVSGKDGNSFTWTMRDFKPVNDVEITYRPKKTTTTAMRRGE